MPAAASSLSQNDWFLPPPGTMPAIPPSSWQHGQLPPGTAYSPSRNQWRTPTGFLLDAGEYKPHWKPAGTAADDPGILRQSTAPVESRVYDPNDVMRGFEMPGLYGVPPTT